jgi:hypothetical protein
MKLFRIFGARPGPVSNPTLDVLAAAPADGAAGGLAPTGLARGERSWRKSRQRCRS